MTRDASKWLGVLGSVLVLLVGGGLGVGLTRWAEGRRSAQELQRAALEARRPPWAGPEVRWTPDMLRRAPEEEAEEEETYWMWDASPARGKGLPPGKEPEVDILEEGHLLLIPKLRLQGPWRDGARRYPGGAQLLAELPLGFCFPGVRELLLELHRESPESRGDAQLRLENPELLRPFLPRYHSHFEPPELDLYGPRKVKKGSKPVSSKSSNPPEQTAVSVKMKVLTLCAGLSASACAAVQVKQVDTGWLEDCPKEARVAIEALGLGMGEPYDVELELEPGRRNETPAFIREGPLVAEWEGLHLGPNFPDSELGRRMKGAKFYGRGKVYGDRMSVHFDRLELADGRKLPICAIGYDVWGKEPGLERWGPGSHEGVRVLNDVPERLAVLAELRPGEFPTPGPTIWISFGTLFKREWLSRR